MATHPDTKRDAVFSGAFAITQFMTMTRTLFTACLPIAMAACSAQPPAAGPVPENLRPAGAQVHLKTLAARGVQIYECSARKDDPRVAQWVFVAPEADLFDEQGRPAGRHFAGPHWEDADGSKIIGSVKASAPAPRADAIAWVLLETKSDGKEGTLSHVTSVQRTNTVGGIAPPASGCNAELIGKMGRVAYSANYVMYTAGK